MLGVCLTVAWAYRHVKGLAVNGGLHRRDAVTQLDHRFPCQRRARHQASTVPARTCTRHVIRGAAQPATATQGDGHRQVPTITYRTTNSRCSWRADWECMMSRNGSVGSFEGAGPGNGGDDAGGARGFVTALVASSYRAACSQPEWNQLTRPSTHCTWTQPSATVFPTSTRQQQRGQARR